MSHLTYYNYDGVGKAKQSQFKYSQAVRVGDRIECAGQGIPLLPSTPNTHPHYQY